MCFRGLVRPPSSINHPAFSRGYLVLFLQIWVASAISTSWIIMISVPLTIVSRTVIAVCILHEWYCDSWVTIWLMHIFGVIYYPGSIIHIIYHPITNLRSIIITEHDQLLLFSTLVFAIIFLRKPTWTMYLRIASDPPGCWQVAAREAQRQNEKTFFSLAISHFWYTSCHCRICLSRSNIRDV